MGQNVHINSFWTPAQPQDKPAKMCMFSVISLPDNLGDAETSIFPFRPKTVLKTPGGPIFIHPPPTPDNTLLGVGGV